MPTSERLLLLRGALAAFETDTTYTPELAAAGVTREGFHLLTRPQRWKGSEVELARRALEGVISASFMVAGVTRFQLTAEYHAAAIASLVNPANWLVAAQTTGGTLDGTRLILPDGDDISAKERVSEERLFALVLVAAAQPNYTTSIAESLADRTNPPDGPGLVTGEVT